MEVIERWQMRVTNLYSTTSNRNHNVVIPNSNAPDIFESLHNKMSATAFRIEEADFEANQIVIKRDFRGN